MLFRSLVGSCVGELMELEGRLHRGVRRLGTKIDLFDHTPEQREHYVTLFVVFCTSGTGIFGALIEGIDGDSSILMTKAAMDFFTTLIFGATVGYSIVSLGFFQLILFLSLYSCSHLIAPLLTPAAIGNFTAVGGIVTLIVGVKLAGIKHSEATNLLPALVFVLIFSSLL